MDLCGQISTCKSSKALSAILFFVILTLSEKRKLQKLSAWFALDILAFCRGTFTPSPFSRNRKHHVLFWNGNQSLESPKMGNLCKMKDGFSFLQYALTKGENIFFVIWIFIQISSLSCTLPHEQRGQKRLVGGHWKLWANNSHTHSAFCRKKWWWWTENHQLSHY